MGRCARGLWPLGAPSGQAPSWGPVHGADGSCIADNLRDPSLRQAEWIGDSACPWGSSLGCWQHHERACSSCHLADETQHRTSAFCQMSRRRSSSSRCSSLGCLQRCERACWPCRLTPSASCQMSRGHPSSLEMNFVMVLGFATPCAAGQSSRDPRLVSWSASSSGPSAFA